MAGAVSVRALTSLRTFLAVSRRPTDLNRTPAFLWLIFGLAFFPLVWLTPPFQVPDEAQHFFRAYQVSEGQWRGTVNDGMAGGVIPRSLSDLVLRHLGTLEIHTARPVERRPLRETWEHIRDPLAVSERAFVNFSGAAFYSPLPYVPQAAAIAVGRALDASPLALLYAARLANGVAALLVLAYALRLTSVGAEGAVVAALLPMALFEYASISPDALVIATAFLFTALMLRLISDGELNRSHAAVACLAATTFCSLKPVYAPMLSLAVPGLLRSHCSRAKLVFLAAWLVVLPLCFTLGWLSWSSAVVVPVHPDINISAQFTHVLEHPAAFIAAALNTLFENKFYLTGVVGVLGWLSIKLPLSTYILAALSFAAAIAAGARAEEKLSPIEIGVGALIVGLSATLIMLALYLYSTPVAAPRVVGVQGRYLLPLLWLVAAMLSSLAPTVSALWRNRLFMIVLAFISVNAVTTQWIIAKSYSVLD